MSKFMKRLTVSILASLVLLTGCAGSTPGYEDDHIYTREEALQELEAKLQNVTVHEVDAPLYIYDEEVESKALADIDVYPITVQGKGAINIEVAAATELSADAPDDLINVWAEEFNRSGVEVNGKTASVTVRKITSGEVLTYMTEGDYRPDVYVPSFPGWGMMLDASGFDTIQLAERIAGNTAGILMKQDVYDAYIEKYGEVTMGKVVEASMAGDLTLAVTNPYTSSTTLNLMAEMLACFDPKNPLSDTASEKLLEYQRTSPPVGYTTAVLTSQAEKGIIDTMVMEEQAYFKAASLRDFVYTPVGVRHDHPVYTFDYVDVDKQAVAREFVEFCQSEKSQKTATEKGFNRHDDYQSHDIGLDGAGYLAVQKIWKANKDGGQPVIAVFIGDVSISMNGKPLDALKNSLLATSSYINSDYYIGLISYSDDVYVHLKPERFDEKQRAYFAGAVRSLNIIGNTATYDAVLVGLQMLLEKAEEVPDAKLMMFLLSDGQRSSGYRIDKVEDIVQGLKIPIYTIGYNLEGDPSGKARDELKQLSGLNEADLIDADSDNIINRLRDLFNVNL